MRYGPYDIPVTARANCRRLRLVYHPAERTLSLSVPRGTSRQAVLQFLDSRRDWIDGHMQGASAWQPAYAAGERHLLLGRYVTLGTDAPADQAELEALRARTLSGVLNRLLPLWQQRMGVRVRRVTLRDMTSRWGSCRKDTASLTFSLRLARVPEEEIEEVVVHELCHLVHANHSADFYALLTRFLPDWKPRRQARNRRDLNPLPPL